jgi:hypothetical protein
VEELLGIWSLDDYEASLEELEEVLIVGADHMRPASATPLMQCPI